MTKVLQNPTSMNVNIQDNVFGSSQSNTNITSDVSARNSDDDSQDKSEHDDSEDEMPKQVKRRVQKFSDSDSDVGKQNEGAKSISQNLSHNNDRNDYTKGLHRKTRRIFNKSSSDSDGVVDKKKEAQFTEKITSNDSDNKSSIKSVLSFVPQQIHKKNSSDSDLSDMPKSPNGSKLPDKSILKSSRMSRLKKINSKSSSDSDEAVKNEQQQLRTKNKRDKMKDRFKSLLTSREKGQSTKEESDKSSDDSSEDEANSSMEKLKQKIKERISSIPSLCDPDTSDDETAHKIQQKSMKSILKQEKERKTKLTSPKPQRMSAKQAMENMQKIKSESNRMLREKEVSLPYHRPKALSLKDIMSRRKPALSSDGKSLPIKMNGEQLKQYAQMLEDRQKQMMDLWQSDTDDDDDENKSSDQNSEKAISDKTTEDLMSSSAPIVAVELNGNTSNNQGPEKLARCETNESNADISADNDIIFDTLSQSNIEDTIKNSSESKEVQSTNTVNEEQDSETSMRLVFNESETSLAEEILVIEDKVIESASNNNNDRPCSTREKTFVTESNTIGDKSNESQDSSNVPNTETDSQLILLHYDTCSEIQANDQVLIDTTDKESNTKTETFQREDECEENITKPSIDTGIEMDKEIEAMDIDGFSDDDMNIEDIDKIIENAEIIRDIEDKVNSQVLIRDIQLNLKPKLTGAPGMVIDLDNSIGAPKKSGVELLKERYTFFAKLKTPEELERAKEKRIKPGRQHLILKQELEEQMAEQRSIEWAKRLDEEKQQQNEVKQLTGEDDDEDDIDKIEGKLNEEERNEDKAESEAESEEELVEDDIDMSDKPRAKNPMLENEAEESDCDGENGVEQNYGDENEGDNENDVDDQESSDSSSESEAEDQRTAKKGRILKAFEDSDDEETAVVETEEEGTESKSNGSQDVLGSQPASQDDVLTLAQRARTASEDLFTSQDSSLVASQAVKSQALPESFENDVDLGTQTFSILDSTNNKTTDLLNTSDKIKDLCEKQNFVNLDTTAMCSGSFSETFTSLPITQTTQSQTIGEDVLALCTGKFYDNEFVSQVNENNQLPLGASQDYDSDVDDSHVDKVETQTAKDIIAKESQSHTDVNADIVSAKVNIVTENDERNKDNKMNKVDDNLRSILDELDDPEFDSPKPNEFFCGGAIRKADLKEQDSQIKKKFTIDSDDDEVKENESERKKQKKLKKRKPEKRALHISDDEDESEQGEEIEEYESEIEEETAERERLVEYDSEENEIVVQPLTAKPSKKKRKGTEFFEQEAELTSEDEWVGSGDEDEAGLDRMEREEGDDETFHQGRLQRELGQIHMRDVLDQDKREVRIIQELLFEDGDLGGGGRQRKFKWKNLGGDEETGSGVNEFGESQEEEFESEEQWRKQRHEREIFLRQMQNTSEHTEGLNVSVDRTTIIKANLTGRTVSMLLDDKPAEKTDSPTIVKSVSPKKPISILQQSYQGSILNRGTSALARLAALATPLAADHDAPKGKSAAQSSGRNFVFAALTPEAPKATKRKAEANPSTPKLVKKMKSEEKRNKSKSSLLDSII